VTDDSGCLVFCGLLVVACALWCGSSDIANAIDRLAERLRPEPAPVVELGSSE
jgi:hypothetical protein